MNRRGALLALLALAGCHSARITPVPHRAVEFQPWSDATPSYRFAPGDKVRVQFLRTPEMNEVALVAPDGAIGLRAAGRVQAAGMTAEDLQAAVATASQRVLIAPVVTASLEEASGSLVMVGGSVNRPGAYPLAGRRGALELILLAGGFDAEARMEEVVLIRRGPGDRPMIRTIDVRAFVQGGDTTGDVPVMPSDIVFVPRSRVAEANLWIDQNINRMLPFSRGFSYAINSGRVNGF